MDHCLSVPGAGAIDEQRLVSQVANAITGVGRRRADIVETRVDRPAKHHDIAASGFPTSDQLGLGHGMRWTVGKLFTRMKSPTSRVGIYRP